MNKLREKMDAGALVKLVLYPSDYKEWPDHELWSYASFLGYSTLCSEQFLFVVLKQF